MTTIMATVAPPYVITYARRDHDLSLLRAEIPHEQSLKMNRDQLVKDLAGEVEASVKVPTEIPSRQSVPAPCCCYQSQAD